MKDAPHAAAAHEVPGAAVSVERATDMLAGWKTCATWPTSSAAGTQRRRQKSRRRHKREHAIGDGRQAESFEHGCTRRRPSQPRARRCTTSNAAFPPSTGVPALLPAPFLPPLPHAASPALTELGEYPHSSKEA